MDHKITRKQFMTTVAGAAALSTIKPSRAHSTQSAKGKFNGKPRRGVSIFSYQGEFGVSMTLEDCFIDMSDMGAEGVEILANGHIPGYPNPSDEWVENWFQLLDKYELVPAEYGHPVLVAQDRIEARQVPVESGEMDIPVSGQGNGSDIHVFDAAGRGVLLRKPAQEEVRVPRFAYSVQNVLR